MPWNFKRDESPAYEVVPEGKHRIRIKNAEKAISSNGNYMLVLQFEVSGYTSIIYHYIVFMEDRPEITNRMLTQFFDSFKDIPEGDFNMNNWIGKAGACVIKHEEYNGEPKPKIRYFLHKDKQGDLPPWKSTGESTPSKPASSTEGGTVPATADFPDDNEGLPFDF